MINIGEYNDHQPNLYASYIDSDITMCGLRS